MEFVRSRKVDAIKARLDHPVIDSDGHAVEFVPLVKEILREQSGDELAEAFGARRNRGTKQGWWAVPSANTLDRGTAMLPALMAARLPEIGIDHAVVYGTLGLSATVLPHDDLRRAVARAFNTYYAETFAEHLDVLTPVGVIPMFTPDEALEELEHAVSVLGLRAFVFGGPIPRPDRVDVLCVDSEYDYDPVWQRCVDLGVSPTFHTTSAGWGSRMSPSSYVFNHLGMFATGVEAMARSMFLGGVGHRFPELRCAFQEGGVAWAANLYSDLVGHWEKRNRDAIRTYDPKALDRSLIEQLFAEYGGPLLAARSDLDAGLRVLSDPDDQFVDEFGSSGVDVVEDIQRLFTERFYFGCEADDPLTALAFDGRRLPLGARLKAVFASDIGHWDVPDAREVLPEAWEMVEKGLGTEDDFRDLVFGNPIELWAGVPAIAKLASR